MIQVDDEGVYHYENEHESLEDEMFELHTANNPGDHEVDQAAKDEDDHISDEVGDDGVSADQ